MIEQIKVSRKKLSNDLKLELERQLYKQSFYEFFKKAVTILKPENWQYNWHHELLSSILQNEAFRINEGKPKKYDYLVNLPPAVTKTKLLICYNAWVWACVNPALSFGCISYSEDLSLEIASDCKDLIENYWYQELFPHIQIRSDRSSISNFKNTLGGSRVSFSLLGGVTGFHFDILLLDDPISSKDTSEIKVENSIRIWKDAIYNRVKNPRVSLRWVMGQRVSDSDLSAFIINNNENGKYYHVCLPMEEGDNISPPELRANYTNGVLWEERFPPESFSDLTTSQLTWATQYLQKPTVLGGTIIKESWFEIVDDIPNDIVYHLFIDTAFTNNRQRDASAIMVAGTKNNIVYVKEVQELFLEFPVLVSKIKEISSKEKPSSKIYIEPKANGRTIIQELKYSTLLNVITLPNVQDSKITRINSITPKLESKRVKLLKGKWNENFLFQLSGFPNAKRDDQVDVLYYAVSELLKDSGKLHWYF